MEKKKEIKFYLTRFEIERTLQKEQRIAHIFNFRGKEYLLIVKIKEAESVPKATCKITGNLGSEDKSAA